MVCDPAKECSYILSWAICTPLLYHLFLCVSSPRTHALTHHSCRRLSFVSSGWKAVTKMFPCFRATISASGPGNVAVGLTLSGSRAITSIGGRGVDEEGRGGATASRVAFVGRLDSSDFVYVARLGRGMAAGLSDGVETPLSWPCTSLTPSSSSPSLLPAFAGSRGARSASSSVWNRRSTTGARMKTPGKGSSLDKAGIERGVSNDSICRKSDALNHQLPSLM